MKIKAIELRPGDVIMPPPRELQLWMKRTAEKRGLPMSALHLTITEIHEGDPDKKGRWLFVTSWQTPEWYDGKKPYAFKFKVRPETPWETISRAA